MTFLGGYIVGSIVTAAVAGVLVWAAWPWELPDEDEQER